MHLPRRELIARAIMPVGGAVLHAEKECAGDIARTAAVAAASGGRSSRFGGPLWLAGTDVDELEFDCGVHRDLLVQSRRSEAQPFERKEVTKNERYSVIAGRERKSRELEKARNAVQIHGHDLP